MLPTALIIPTADAAVDSLRISVGIAQKLTRNAAVARVTRLNNTTVSGVELGRVTRASNAVAARNSGIAVCQRLSRRRSECHPLISMAANAATYGIAPMSPTRASESPDWRFRIVGNQK